MGWDNGMEEQTKAARMGWDTMAEAEEAMRGRAR